MIQRIQSLLLLLTSVTMAITSFSPLLNIHMQDSSIITFFAEGIVKGTETIQSAWGVIGITYLSALLPFINIFLFKKRKIQMKIGYLTSFLVIVFYITLIAYLYFFINKNGAEFGSIHYGICLPLIALILNIMAISKIKKDEQLVRSLDRIR